MLYECNSDEEFVADVLRASLLDDEEDDNDDEPFFDFPIIPEEE